MAIDRRTVIELAAQAGLWVPLADEGEQVRKLQCFADLALAHQTECPGDARAVLQQALDGWDAETADEWDGMNSYHPRLTEAMDRLRSFLARSNTEHGECKYRHEHATTPSRRAG